MGGVVSQSIPNFLNGISQQTPTQRGINQAEEQVNLQNNIVDGLSKRPAFEYIDTIDATNVYPNTVKFWSIQRDKENQFVVILYNGGVKVYDLDGNEKTVTVASGSSYLTTTNPKADFKLVNIADYTFIANKSKTVLADTTLSTAKIEEFYINVVTSNYGREYAVTVRHPNMSYDVKASLQMPSGSNLNHDAVFRDTAHIADILFRGTSSTHFDSSSDASFKLTREDTGATLSTTQGLGTSSEVTNYFTMSQYPGVIRGISTNGNSNYTVLTADGSGNTGMYSIRDEISDFTKLPYHASTDSIIKVTGDEGDTLSDYYVKFETDGVWKETIGQGVSLGLDNSTMPHALINNNDGTFTFQEIDYDDRNAGDGITNSNPSFVGNKINNLLFYKNRLGILARDNLILSENAGFFNFFSKTVTQVLDTDAIDIAASGSEVNTLFDSVAFNESLLLFSEKAQYKLGSVGETISPTSAVLNEVSAFEFDANVKPVSAGKYAYFAQARNNNTAIREYYADDDTLTNDGLDITVSVQNLIPSNAYQLISNTTEDTLIALASDTADTQLTPYTTGTPITSTNGGTMFIYKYFFDKGEKVQTAWSKWTFTNAKILGGMSFESFVYLLVVEGTDTKLVKIDLRNLRNGTIGFNVYLDLRTSVTGTYDANTNLTTFTSPYGAKTGLIAVDGVNGNNYAVTNTAGATYTLEGNHTNLIIGIPYESKYRMSPQYVRESSGRGLVAITSGRYQIRNISLNYETSGYFQVEVTPNGRDTSYSFMNGYVIGTATSKVGVPAISSGTIKVPVSCRNTDFTLDIKSSSHLPMYIASAEVEGYYHNRSTRI
ncbi:tail tubular protein B [Pelagibacter phage HTVC031P]|nr:tail tubular protein B [Pelagibacter phage HTVC031P]